jgi:starch synthase
LPQGIQEKEKKSGHLCPVWVDKRTQEPIARSYQIVGDEPYIDDTDHPLIIKVASIQSARMQVYFIDNEDYFQRKSFLQNCDGKYFEDNDERAIFFARGVLETVQKLRWSPDIIHCHGWFTAFVPLFVKRTFKDNPLFCNSKVIYSVYNDGFDSPLNKNLKNKLIYDSIVEKDVSVINDPSFDNLTKLALIFGRIIMGVPHQSGIETFAKSTGKPFLSYQDTETYIDKYSDFYEQFL